MGRTGAQESDPSFPVRFGGHSAVWGAAIPSRTDTAAAHTASNAQSPRQSEAPVTYRRRQGLHRLLLARRDPQYHSEQVRSCSWGLIMPKTAHAADLDREPTAVVPPRWRIAVVVLVGLAIMIARRPDGAAGLYLWAEDGSVFMIDAFQRGATSLFDSYEAQWWVTSRLAIWPIVYLPAQWWPLAAYVVACVIGTLGMSVVLQARAAPVLGPFPLRVVLFFVLIAQPLAFEIQGNVANIHVWLAMALLVILVLPAPRTLAGRAGEIAFIGASGLTGFVGLIVWPVAVWGFLRDRTRFGLLRLVVVTAAALTNVFVTWGTRSPGASTAQDYLVTSSALLVKRFAGGMLLGDTYQLRLWADSLLSPWAVPAIGLLLAVGFVAGSDWRGPSPAWLASGLLWLVLGTSTRIQGPWEELLHPFVVGRYLDLLVAATILIVFRALCLPSRPGRIVAIGTLFVMSFSMVTGLFIPQEPLGVRLRLDRGELVAFGECVSERTGPCTLPIVPSGWTLTIEGEPS